MSFAQFAAALDYPMYIATVPGGGSELDGDGCLIGFATQCSIDPPRFLACISNKNRTYRLAGEAEHMAIHLVPADRPDLAELFGGETADEVDKLARCDWQPGPGGAPLIDGCPTWFAGRILDRIDFGDHAGFVLDPIEGEGEPEPAVGFQRARGIEPGHEP